MLKSSDKWLDWAKEIQSIAQNGLTYTKDIFDKERFERFSQYGYVLAQGKMKMLSEVLDNLSKII